MKTVGLVFFVLLWAGVPYAANFDKKLPIKIPFLLKCAVILDNNFPSFRDPVEISVRSLHIEFINLLNKSGATDITLVERKATQEKVTGAIESQLSRLSNNDQVRLLVTVASSNLGLSKELWSNIIVLASDGWKPVSDGVKVWCVDKLIKMQTDESLNSLGLFLYEHEGDEIIEHIKQVFDHPKTSLEVSAKSKIIAKLTTDLFEIENKLASGAYDQRSHFNAKGRLIISEATRQFKRRTSLIMNLRWLLTE